MTISSISSSSSYINQLANMRTRASSGETQQATGKKPDFSKMFSTMDADSSGSLDSTEVQSLAEKISEATGVSVDLSEFLATYDSDGDGTLSEEETLASLEANRPQGPPPGGMMGGGPDESDMVSAADENGDGVISEEEAEGLVSIINNATGSSLTAADFISENDENSDGSFSTDEAVAAMEANRPQGPPPPPGGTGGMRGSDESNMVSAADENGDGVISAEEAAGLVQIINNATGSSLDAEDFISTYDEDGDGSFSTDEAVAAMEANRPQGPTSNSENLASASGGIDSVLAKAIDNYLKMATLGMDGQASGDLFSMLDSNSSSLSNIA
ncbi:XopAW family type III secretion system calcium-binding effector [uncultured Desulfobulbus sp.]|uniref:XopAW family type III secretion system calcium-binding effector n=1 Tax=uncultured Desulfobulbus sp. TaxID=239745 RepID=UPI0029C8231E|nr:XopAW family type III secretion system calcium-binding effector [uncultured Desulfobulbus sp.]